jgi:anti-sigma B factor antagonist
LDVVEFAGAPPTLRPPRQFTCARADARAGAARVHLTGELDLATAALLERALREAQANASQVVLDLRRLTFMDCSGMRVIVGAAQRARRAGQELTVVPGPAQVERVFTLTGGRRRVETAAVPADLRRD